MWLHAVTAVCFAVLGLVLDLALLYALAAFNVVMAGWQLFRLRRSSNQPVTAKRQP